VVSSSDETRTSRDETSDTLVDTPGSQPANASRDRIGRYEVLGELGRGGMGVVYRARDPELDRALAIKVVVPVVKREQSRQRLLDEARALAKLQHPAVVPVIVKNVDVWLRDRHVRL
jgi:serine/threonine-protein kinase